MGITGTVLMAAASNELKLLSSHLDTMRGAIRDKISQLEMSEKKFRSYVDAAPTGIIVVDNLGRYLDANRSACRISGYSKETLLGLSIRDIFHPNSLIEGIEHFRAAQEAGYAQRDLTLINSNGDPVVCNVVTIRLSPVRFLGYMWDITQRKKSEDEVRRSLREKDVLIKEIHHRVKNNLNLVSGLLEMQAVAITSPDDFRAAFENSISRIYSMALVHESLYRETGFVDTPFGIYVQNLVDHIFVIFNHDSKISVEYDLEEICLDVNRAVPCGLIVNELVTNAFKHAFPDNSGVIKIVFRKDGGRILLMVADDGQGVGGEQEMGRAGSLGFQLVKTLTRQLHGEVAVRSEKGLAVEIRFMEESS